MAGRSRSWRVAYDEEFGKFSSGRNGGFRRSNSRPIRRARRGTRAMTEPPHPTGARRQCDGLAFSGGGIRARRQLGVPQRLQELDLLRGVDYSHRTGGGYIGAGCSPTSAEPASADAADRLGTVHRTSPAVFELPTANSLMSATRDEGDGCAMRFSPGSALRFARLMVTTLIGAVSSSRPPYYRGASSSASFCCSRPSRNILRIRARSRNGRCSVCSGARLSRAVCHVVGRQIRPPVTARFSSGGNTAGGRCSSSSLFRISPGSMAGRSDGHRSARCFGRVGGGDHLASGCAPCS